MNNQNNDVSRVLAELYAWLIVIGAKLTDFGEALQDTYGNEVDIVKQTQLLISAVRVCIDQLRNQEPRLDKLPLESIISIKNNNFNFDKLNFKKDHSKFDFRILFNNFIVVEEYTIKLKTNLKQLKVNPILIEEVEEIALDANKLIEIVEDYI